MPKTETPIIILADNGSTKASASLALRGIAKHLSECTHQEINPVSLQHANVISADELGGIKAIVLKDFLRDKLKKDLREFTILPLFFGNSRALTKFIPDVHAELEEEFGVFSIKVKATLFKPHRFTSDSDSASSGLSEIIYDHILQTAKKNSFPLENIVLVDHGSPSPQITAVRNGVAEEVQAKFKKGITLEQAVMERRVGKEYDFNGKLLEEWLIAKAKQSVSGKKISAIVALMFSLPGRHAGEGGDIETICKSVMKRYPNFKIGISPLVGEHPLLLDILSDRLNA